MIKLVKGQSNKIDLKIVATYPVGDVHGVFIAKTVSIEIPASRYGTTFTLTEANVDAIGDEMIAVVKLYDSKNVWITTLRVPVEVLPAGSSNEGFNEIRTTLVYIRAVEGEGHCGAAIKMYGSYAELPQPGNQKYLYLTKDTNKLYRWNETISSIDKYVEVNKEVAVTNGISPNDGEKIWVDESEMPEPVVLQSQFEGISQLDNATLNDVSQKVNTIIKKLQGI